jgi:hypothetical protein
LFGHFYFLKEFIKIIFALKTNKKQRASILVIMKKKFQIKQFLTLASFLMLVLLAVQCKHDPQQLPNGPGDDGNNDSLNIPKISTNCSADTVYFQNDVLPLLVSNCASCHSSAISNSGVILTDYASIMKTTIVIPGSPAQSEIVKKMRTAENEGRMPPPPALGLTEEQIALISKWIDQGAINNQCNGKECDTLNVTYKNNVRPIIDKNCLGCHSGPTPSYGIDLTNYDHIAAIAQSGSLLGALNHAQGFYPMPKEGNKLIFCDIRTISIWVRDTSFSTLECDTSNVTYPGTVFPILQAKCMNCHSGPTPQGNLDFNNYSQVAYLAQTGVLMGALRHEAGYEPMPKDGNMLDDCSLAKINIWVRDTIFEDPGGGNDDPCDPDTVYFQNEVFPLIISNCNISGCHDKLTEEQEVLLTDYASIIYYGEVTPGDPFNSKLYKVIIEDEPEDMMPPAPQTPLTTGQKNIIKKWIEQGAKNNACNEDCDTLNVTYGATIWPLIQTNCYGCHSGANPSGGIPLIDYNSVVAAANSGKLYGSVSHSPGFVAMPKNAPKLSDCKIDQIRIWIENGKPNN